MTICSWHSIKSVLTSTSKKRVYSQLKSMGIEKAMLFGVVNAESYFIPGSSVK